MSQIVIGTAGHIDHGKTALVEALTGFNTDRLPEEQARGMTIDLGFAFLNKHVTLIDVPGHEKFIRNMVAGVSTIHMVLLVVAADDGVMPQTREHLQIVNLLGIPRGVIALTKTDLVDDPEWLDLVEADIRELVQDTVLETAPILRTSTLTAEGIEALREALFREVDKVRLTGDRGFFRLHVDRTFVKKGFGLVVTGTVVSGKTIAGDELICLPVEEKGKIRGLQSHGNSVETVFQGDRAAVNLTGIDRTHIWRGSQLVTPGWIEPTRRFIAHVNLVSDSEWVLKSKQRIRVHLGTEEVLGRVAVLGKTLRQGESGKVIFQLEQPLGAATDDRFVIRSYSPMETIGGGFVLDPHPEGKWKAIQAWGRVLKLDRGERFCQSVNRDWNRPRTMDHWTHYFHGTEEELNSFVKGNELHIIPDTVLIYSDDMLKTTQKKLLDCFSKFHKQYPYRKSTNGESFRHELDLSAEWFETVVKHLLEGGEILKSGSGYAQADHEISISDRDKNKLKVLGDILTRSGFIPMTILELSGTVGLEENQVQDLLYIMKDQNLVVKIGMDHWLHWDNLRELTVLLDRYFQEQDSLTVSDFKTMTGLTRKFAIPLLEYCDLNHITIRKGDVREQGTYQE